MCARERFGTLSIERPPHSIRKTMTQTQQVEQTTASQTEGTDPRAALISDLPVTERRARLAGISTAFLEGGKGPTLVLLHGPGEFAAKWLRVLPDLVGHYHVVAPDLPGHGASTGPGLSLDAEDVLGWLGAVVDQTSTTPPTIVGHVLGGAIGARFAIENQGQAARLVLVDSLGLDSFRPSLWFALSMIGFLLRPTEGSYRRFMRQCSFDLDRLRDGMGDRWEPFKAYNLEQARSPNGAVARQLMRKVGLPRIDPDALAQIDLPTTLIWGRHDRALPLRIAEEASERYGWPLHIIENCADDPPLDQPEAFVDALRSAMVGTA